MSKVPCGGFKLDENFLGMNENDELSLTGGGEGKAYQYVVTDGEGGVKWEDRLAYDNKESASFAICTSGYAEFPDDRGYYDIPDEMWKLLLNENAKLTDVTIGAPLMDRRVDESKGIVYYETGDLIGVTELRVSTIYKQAYLFNNGLSDGAIGVRHTVTASVDDFKQIDQKFIPSELNEIILPSSTSSSTKKFKITVDDSGTISATEV